MKLRISVVAKFCGPASVGTVDLIRLIQRRCGFGLVEAKDQVDRAVFGGESVEIELPSNVDGEELVREILELETPAEISAQLIQA